MRLFDTFNNNLNFILKVLQVILKKEQSLMIIQRETLKREAFEIQTEKAPNLFEQILEQPQKKSKASFLKILDSD